MTTIAATTGGLIDPHHRYCGKTRLGPTTSKHATRPTLEGLKRWRPPGRIRYFDRSDKTPASTKYWMPCRLHQSPCRVPDARRMKATMLPVRIPLAGLANIRLRQGMIFLSYRAHTPF